MASIKYHGLQTKLLQTIDMLNPVIFVDQYFHVTGATCLFQEHFRDEDIKRNSHCWKVVTGAVLPHSLYFLVTPRPSRIEPRNCNSSQLSNQIPKNACTSSTSASSLSLGDVGSNDVGTISEHDYSLSKECLCQDILELTAKVKSLENENNEVRGKFFLWIN